MRDIFIVVAIAMIALAALKRPQIGILGWLWLSIMAPHRLAYGFSYSLPVLDGLVAITMLSCLMHWNQRNSAAFTPILKLLLAFYIWCTLTTIFSVDFLLSQEDWLDFTKTMLLVAVILLFMNKKHWILATCFVYVISVGFYGFKGGVFTLMTGGGNHVLGPPGTDWGDNNGMSLALLMTMPLTLGLLGWATVKWQRLGLIGGAASFFFAILGTQSRGGFIGLCGLCGMVIMRSNRKFLFVCLITISAIVGYQFMPQSWHERMQTIVNYEQEGSANTRLIQWQYAIDISTERPFFGNGFDAFFYQPYYYLYVADKDNNRAVHSNYFQVLGEQGYIGIVMYLGLILSMVVGSKREAKRCQHRKDLKWASTLLAALQFSVIGYAINGITVNTAYIDLFYYLIAVYALLTTYVTQQLATEDQQLTERKAL